MNKDTTIQIRVKKEEKDLIDLFLQNEEKNGNKTDISKLIRKLLFEEIDSMIYGQYGENEFDFDKTNLCDLDGVGNSIINSYANKHYRKVVNDGSYNGETYSFINVKHINTGKDDIVKILVQSTNTGRKYNVVEHFHKGRWLHKVIEFEEGVE
jgi:hypothetical protein